MGITTREFGPNAKGSKLSIAEMDENCNYLNNLQFTGYESIGSKWKSCFS